MIPLILSAIVTRDMVVPEPQTKFGIRLGRGGLWIGDELLPLPGSESYPPAYARFRWTGRYTLLLSLDTRFYVVKTSRAAVSVSGTGYYAFERAGHIGWISIDQQALVWNRRRYAPPVSEDYRIVGVASDGMSTLVEFTDSLRYGVYDINSRGDFTLRGSWNLKWSDETLAVYEPLPGRSFVYSPADGRGELHLILGQFTASGSRMDGLDCLIREGMWMPTLYGDSRRIEYENSSTRMRSVVYIRKPAQASLRAVRQKLPGENLR